MVKWGFGASVRVEIILRGADRSVLARNIESAALRPCQVAREPKIAKQVSKYQQIHKSWKSKIPTPCSYQPTWAGSMVGARGFLCDISRPRRMMDGGLASFQNSSCGGGGGGVQTHWKV